MNVFRDTMIEITHKDLAAQIKNLQHDMEIHKLLNLFYFIVLNYILFLIAGQL